MDDKPNAQPDAEKEDHKTLVRRHLKVLLLHLAAKSDHPSQELESLLKDVINELHDEVKDAFDPRGRLRLVPQAEPAG